MGNKSIEVSVITWDGGFREQFHTVDFFCNQSLPETEYEFIWAEYYSSINSDLKGTISNYPNARAICLDLDGDWHVGKCMNRGLAASFGNHLVLIDGDIAVNRDFLEKDLEVHEQYPGTAVYYRRWDEPQASADNQSRRKTIEYLDAHCRMMNPTNYGGCLTLGRELIEAVNGYEEHSIFAGSGAINMELYVRLVNSGVPVMWHPSTKVYHPWHRGTIPSNKTAKIFIQKDIIKNRSLNIDIKSDPDQVERYMSKISVRKKSKKNRRIKRQICQAYYLNGLKTRMETLFKSIF